MSYRLGEATRNDFRTDTDPTLFRDNWGRDVVVDNPEKIKAPIDAAVALAQLMSSILDGTALDPGSLDCGVLDGIAFFDANDGENDHFFNVELEPRYSRGSYKGPRVSASLKTGFVRLKPAHPKDDTTYATYDDAWTTRRGDRISERDRFRFKHDLTRLTDAFEVLEGRNAADLVTERPDSWRGELPDRAAYRAGIHRLHIIERPIYLGSAPTQDVVIEPLRRVYIPFLDN